MLSNDINQYEFDIGHPSDDPAENLKEPTLNYEIVYIDENDDSERMRSSRGQRHLKKGNRFRL